MIAPDEVGHILGYGTPAAVIREPAEVADLIKSEQVTFMATMSTITRMLLPAPVRAARPHAPDGLSAG